ncbi:MAG: NUDIX hydrolase [Nanobdellota archaeon]
MKHRPRASAAVVVENNGKILLGQRNKKNANGLWVIPGGGIDFGERIKDAAEREIKEESNIDLFDLKFLFHKEIINIPGNFHAIVFFFKAKAKNPDELKHDDDLSEIGFFSKEEILYMIKERKTVKSVEEVLKDMGYLDNGNKSRI